MNTATGPAVIVGVDGTPSALRAVRLATLHAHRRHQALRIIHAFIWPLLHVTVDPPADAPPGAGLRCQAERIVTDAVAEAEATIAGLPVTGEIIDGEAAAVLLRESPTAALIVLGDRGLGAFTALLVGSVAIRVASHADCPVLVVRGADRHSGPVVVGVDGSPLSQRAIHVAAEEAALRHAPLVALHARQYPILAGPGSTPPLAHEDDSLRTAQDRILAESLAGLSERYPQLTITRELVDARPGPALTDASTQAQLVVVGAHGRGELTGLLLGSVSQSLLHHSDCPVAIVRAPGHD